MSRLRQAAFVVGLALGLAPGPEVGRVLAAVYEKQLDGEVTTHEGAVAAARVLLNLDETITKE